MTKLFLAAAMILVGSYALAAQPTILGEWNLSSRACTSNTPLNDGAVQINVVFNVDSTYVLKRTAAGCQTEIKGTYAVEGRKVVFTSVTAQNCTDTFPQPMPETYSMYAAYHSEAELVLVATGNKAVACPSTDALILNYEKVQPPLR
jgi:hypothetical protein